MYGIRKKLAFGLCYTHLLSTNIMPDATLSNGNNRSHYLNGVCDFNVIFPKPEISGKLLPTQALFIFNSLFFHKTLFYL